MTGGSRLEFEEMVMLPRLVVDTILILIVARFRVSTVLTSVPPLLLNIVSILGQSAGKAANASRVDWLQFAVKREGIFSQSQKSPPSEDKGPVPLV